MNELKKLTLPSLIAVSIMVLIGIIILTSQPQENSENESQNISNNPTETPQENVNPDNNPGSEEVQKQSLIDKTLYSIGLKKKENELATEKENPESNSNATVKGEIKNMTAFGSMLVCAKNIKSSEEICTQIAGENNNVGYYELKIPPGQYFVYASIGFNDIVGLYNEQATCKEGVDCSKSPIVLSVEGGKTYSGINPDDWFSVMTPP